VHRPGDLPLESSGARPAKIWSRPRRTSNHHLLHDSAGGGPWSGDAPSSSSSTTTRGFREERFQPGWLSCEAARVCFGVASDFSRSRSPTLRLACARPALPDIIGPGAARMSSGARLAPPIVFITAHAPFVRRVRGDEGGAVEVPLEAVSARIAAACVPIETAIASTVKAARHAPSSPSCRRIIVPDSHSPRRQVLPTWWGVFSTIIRRRSGPQSTPHRRPPLTDHAARWRPRLACSLVRCR